MLITKHQPSKDGIISIKNCVTLLTMGLQENIVTLWAVTDPVTQQGIPLRFHVKKDNDSVTVKECQRYVTSFISNKGVGVFHLFGEEAKLAPSGPINMPTRPGPSQDPGGKILTS